MQCKTMQSNIYSSLIQRYALHKALANNPVLTSKQCDSAISNVHSNTNTKLQVLTPKQCRGVVLTTKQCDPCENVCLAMLTTSNCNFGVVSQTFANFTNSTMESLRCAPKSDTIWTFPGEIRHTGEGGISC